MNHDILGNVQPKIGESGVSIATVEYDSRNVEFELLSEGEPMEEVLQFAADVAVRLGEIDKAARRVIVTELLETYNDNWAEFDQVQKDGSVKTVSNPKLSESEFQMRFSLNAVHVYGADSVSMFYDDSGLFAGHYVIVSSTCGADFSDAHCELFG